MRGVINRQLYLSELFKSLIPEAEVYADSSFDLSHTCIEIYVLTRVDFNTALMLYKIQAIFPAPCKLYFTKRNKDLMLHDKKIIWKKGVWYY